MMATDGIQARLEDRGLYWRRAAVAAGIAASADWLFFGHGLGVSITIFAIVVVAGSLICNPVTASARTVALCISVLTACLLPAIEDCSALSFGFAVAGVAFFARATMADVSPGFVGKLLDSGLMLLSGPLRLFAHMDNFDRIKVPTEAASRPSPSATSGSLAGWILPLGLGAIFVGLFVTANPVFETLIPAFDLWALLASLSLQRILFWLAIAAATWSFVVVRMPTRMARKETAAPIHPPQNLSPSAVFSQTAVLRSLIVFNLIFALQTVSDLTFLWGGLALPRGMTLATYAHRGAFPLIVTALLAGAFVLATMRPGGAAERSGLMRALVFVWIGQNVLLVLSSILRLDLYVATYSLTVWRVAAFIWMALVAGGLVLLVSRIFMRWSNAWLVSATLALLIATLYGCCFVNFPRVIATYNIAHARQLVSDCKDFDPNYLFDLGPQIIPALELLPTAMSTDGFCRGYVLRARKPTLVEAHRSSMSDWRGWTFRGWRLSRYLNAHAAP